MSSSGFYRAFEERFYAPREIIKGLRLQYLPFLEPLAAVHPGGLAFDIGCGRGEWLEILLERGFSPFGMDLDAGMLQACTERGLPAKHGDAVAHLQSLADESQAVVTAFHVVEHIPFDSLKSLVVEALRVLKPGGLLIMETPNPENIAVATRNFWLDPTHIRPLPPMLLAFLPEFHGFARVSTLRLQEPSDIHTRPDITLTDVLHHVSPDYAVVAQKGAPAEFCAKFDAAFTAAHGIGLPELAGRYDDKLKERLGSMEQRLLQTENQQSKLSDFLARESTLTQRFIESLENRAQLAEARSKEAEARLQQTEVRANDSENKLIETQQRLEMVYASVSWRALAPIRRIVQILKRLE